MSYIGRKDSLFLLKWWEKLPCFVCTLIQINGNKDVVGFLDTGVDEMTMC